MKWGSEKDKAQTVFYYLAAIVLVLVILGMLTDFISWKSAVGMIKRNLPTNGAYNGMEYKFNWLWFTKPVRFHIYLSSDEDLNLHTYYDTQYKKKVEGLVDGVLPGVGGFEAPITQNEFETQASSAKGMWQIKGNIYLLNKGKKVYKKVFVGYAPVDYPITPNIINTYKQSIDPDNDMTQDVIEWLCTFSHDSLHQYIVKMFETGKQQELFQKPGIYAYRLDSVIASQVKWKKEYKKIFTGKRTALLGIVYTIDNQTYFDFIRGAYRISCHNGGYVWSDLK